MPEPLTFKQLQTVLAEAGVTKGELFEAARPELYSYRQNVLSKYTPEEGFKIIFDRGDATSGTKRRTHRNSAAASGNTPNTARVEAMTQSKGYAGARGPVEAVFFHFLMAETDQSYADAIGRNLFGAPFFEHFEDKLRKMGVEIPRRGKGLDTFHFGNIALRLNHDPDARPLSFPKPDIGALFEDGTLLPLEALRWNNAVSNSYGRGDKITDIRDWAKDPDPRAKLRLIYGAGGVGKTRLAADAAVQLEKKGWEVGFLPGDVGDPSAGIKLKGGGVGTLLIIDYPEERPKLVQAIFEAVAGDQNHCIPVRILLVSRESEDAWRKSTSSHIKRLSVTPLEMSGALDIEDAYELIESAAIFLTSQPGIDEIDVTPARAWLEQNAQNRIPLFALAAAVHALTSPDQAFALEGREIIKALVDIELSRIRRFSLRDLSVSDHQDNKFVLEQLLALGLLSGEGVSTEALYALGEQEIAPGTKGHDLLQRVARTPYWKRDADRNCGGFLGRIEPDIVAATLFQQALLKNPIPLELPAWMACTSHEAGDGFLGILSRLCFDLALADPNASRDLETAAIGMFDAAPNLVDGFSNLLWQRGSVFSAGFSVHLLQLALQRDVSVETRPALLNTLAIMLSEIGDREAALAAAQEAVDLYRKLAKARPDAFLPDLATSLNNLAIMLSELGHPEAALAAAQEAVDLYRKLAKARPDAFLPDLAMSLNNLANRLSELGRKEEALAAAQEAVDLRRKLAKARPDAFLPNLAVSLNNLANILSELGDPEAALAAAQEAVDLRRKLAKARPDAFLPDLAASLNNLANRLSELGRKEEALAAAQKAVSTLRPFFLKHPRAFANNMRVMCRVYIDLCKELGIEPDMELLQPIIEMFERMKRGEI